MKHIKLMMMTLAIALMSCTDNNEPVNELIPDPPANLIVKFKFDATQERLDNSGEPATIPVGNAAQSPVLARMSANYIEFSPSETTLLGDGDVVFSGVETETGGDLAIDFQNASFAGNDEIFATIPLSQLSVGDYNWVRISLSYQEGAIDFLAADGNDYTGTLASFIGYNNYITSFDLNDSTFEINENKLQGFWAFETLGVTSQGQAPEGATTVPNPLFDTSPIPAGSCVVTGQFENTFTVTGEETEDIEVTLSFSINNSFEWTEVTEDGKYEPAAGEQVVDMGIRGLIPSISN